jgi:hypothetical protein
MNLVASQGSNNPHSAYNEANLAMLGIGYRRVSPFYAAQEAFDVARLWKSEKVSFS